MKIPPALRILGLWLLATLVGLTLTVSPSVAEPSSTTSPAGVAPEGDDAPVERPEPAAPTPKGVSLSVERSASSLSVDATVAPSASSSLSLDEDDLDFTITPLSTSQCGAGYLCIWSLSNYTGTLQRFKTESQFSTIYLSRVGSFFNNRPDRFFIYQYAGGSTSACFAPRAKRASTSGWLSTANSVYLSTATNC